MTSQLSSTLPLDLYWSIVNDFLSMIHEVNLMSFWQNKLVIPLCHSLFGYKEQHIPFILLSQLIKLFTLSLTSRIQLYKTWTNLQTHKFLSKVNHSIFLQNIFCMLFFSYHFVTKFQIKIRYWSSLGNFRTTKRILVCP
jgi:hypothetical protein